MLFDLLARVHTLYNYSYGVGGTVVGVTMANLLHTYKVSPAHSLLIALGIVALLITLHFHNQAIQSSRYVIARLIHRDRHEQGRGK